MSIFFIFQNIFILMLIFWLLSWLGDKFYKNKYYKNTLESYECGFLNVFTLKISFNMSFFLIVCLLILYDIEFIFLIPLYFNLLQIYILSVWYYWFFFILITFSFIIDWENVILDWLE